MSTAADQAYRSARTETPDGPDAPEALTGPMDSEELADSVDEEVYDDMPGSEYVSIGEYEVAVLEEGDGFYGDNPFSEYGLETADPDGDSLGRYGLDTEDDWDDILAAYADDADVDLDDVVTEVAGEEAPYESAAYAVSGVESPQDGVYGRLLDGDDGSDYLEVAVVEADLPEGLFGFTRMDGGKVAVVNKRLYEADKGAHPNALQTNMPKKTRTHEVSHQENPHFTEAQNRYDNGDIEPRNTVTGARLGNMEDHAYERHHQAEAAANEAVQDDLYPA